MAITFTPQQRKDITRRQLNIASENAAYAATVATLNAESAKLLAVDSANKAFYDNASLMVSTYEIEARSQSGSTPATYTDGQIEPYIAGDLSTSAKFPGAAGALFFPSTPPYVHFIPKVVDAVNGINFPVGTEHGETQILSSAVVRVSLTQLIFRLSNGISGAVADSEILSTAIPAGDIAGHVVTIANATNFQIGELVYIRNGAASGIYLITNRNLSGTDTLTLSSVIPTLIGIASGATCDNAVSAFTGTERQTLVTGTYQEILTNITDFIALEMGNWESVIDMQIAQLTANPEDRSPYTTQNAAALVDVNATKPVIDAWQALPDTGVTGKYVAASLVPVQAEIAARQAFIATRVPQIVAALGSVSQTDNTYSGVVGSPYYERYRWLNIRINRSSGSATRYYGANDGKEFLQMLSSDNTAVQSQYDLYFLTKAITALDETEIVQVKSVSGFSVGDTVKVVSETQAEIERAIMEIMGTTQLRLDKPIPNLYRTEDQARLFKQL